MDSKLIVGNVLGDTALFLLETKMTNEGVIPYWFYNLKYHVHMFDLVNLVILYFALHKLKNEMKAKPHNFIEIEQI